MSREFSVTSVLLSFNFLFLFQEIIPMLQSEFLCPFGLRVRGAYPPLCSLWLFSFSSRRGPLHNPSRLLRPTFSTQPTRISSLPQNVSYNFVQYFSRHNPGANALLLAVCAPGSSVCSEVEALSFSYSFFFFTSRTFVSFVAKIGFLFNFTTISPRRGQP